MSMAVMYNGIWGLIFCSRASSFLFCSLSMLKPIGTSQGTSQITLYSKLTPQFSSSVSAKLGPQFTSSFSAGAREDPYSKIAALKYLNAHGCSNIDLYYKYSCVLDEKRALELLWVKDTYEERIAFLEVIYKENYVSSRGLFGKYSIHTPAEGGRTCT